MSGAMTMTSLLPMPTNDASIAMAYHACRPFVDEASHARIEANIVAS
jgi:hypothetical protein